MFKQRFARAIFILAGLASVGGLAACNGSGDSSGTNGNPSGIPGGTTTTNDPVGTSPLNPPAGAGTHTYTTAAMIFNGAGAWTTEVANLEAILTSNGASYQEVTSAQVNAMTLAQLTQFGVLVFPGGAGGTEAASLTAATHALIREAVQVNGVNYLGFCAGAFIAVAPAPAAGHDVSYGIGVVDGPVLDYYQLENQGIDIQMTEDTFPDGTTKDILWYGGPVTPNTPHGVVAKYPDGNPAISEMWSGNGFVVISGIHPTATLATLSGLGMSSNDGAHTDIAWNLFNAALTQTPLAAF